MIKHTDLGDTPFARSRRLKILVDAGEIAMGGNSKLQIYGILQCRSGKRMKVENRMFFKSVAEAETFGYRPCGHCMREEYLRWKAKLLKQ